MLLSCKNVQKSYGIENVLTDVTFLLEEGEKSALIGVNGAGKTTLLRMLTGEAAPDGGTIIRPKQIVTGYLPQLAELDSRNGVYKELIQVFSKLMDMEREMRDLEHRMSFLSGAGLKHAMAEYDKLTLRFEDGRGYEYESRTRGVIKGLGFTEAEWGQPIWQLSGGQKTRVALGKLLLTEPDLLLLDEPTNHLDIESIGWLEDYLRGYKAAVIIVSHDRYFLDRIVTKVIEIENKKSKVYAGNYTFYARYKTEDREAAIKRYLDQRKEIRRQEAVIARLKSFNREKSIKQAESKEKRLGKLERVERPESLPDKMRIILTPRVQSGNDVLDVTEASKSFFGRPLFEHVTFSLKRGDKAALIGPNGVGKTTLFRMIMGETAYETGYISRGVNVRLGYYDQEHESLNNDKIIFDEISDAYPSLSSTAVRNVLAAFVFTGDDVFKPISALSGGEKSRVALAKIMLGGANMLILDEPTNHLDMVSKEILEETLREYTGTLLYISHDRYFINNTATRVIELSKSGADIYEGNYDFYLEKKRSAQREEADVSPNRGVWAKKKDSGAGVRKRQNAINKTELEIEKTEKTLAELEEKLSMDEVGRDAELSGRYFNERAAVESRLLRLYEEWDKLSDG
ncbi:MAG: ABC-F family ATP-binding cassette domain-containing protein [Clostridiales bacterium]|jgi:ATP-binding cassette subfamily F protein 3|nr:ABC-F family ATP-binding cassette domain-containing protein [Clostridiales bacterium]